MIIATSNLTPFTRDNIMKRIIISLFVILASFTSLAETPSPYTTLENVGQSLFTRIAANQDKLAKFPLLMDTIVDEELMPHIDYQYAALRILDKNLKHTTKEQRQLFTDSMRHYLIRTYAIALQKYNNQEVRFEADKPTKDRRIVSVTAEIIELGKPSIEIVFQMRQDKQSQQWKAFDMIVEGISLLDSKKAELSHKIAKLGVEQVALELAYVEK